MFLDTIEAIWGTNRLYLKVGMDGVREMKWETTQNLVEVSFDNGVNMVVNLHQMAHFKYTFVGQ